MKFFTYLYYFIRSIVLRGPFNSLRLIIGEAKFEKKFNIKSAGLIRSNEKEFFHYQGASYLILLKILSNESQHIKSFNFIDIGSGMGRAVFVAEYCGYKKLLGIELNEELVKIAEQNLTTYSFKKKDSIIQFVNENALNFLYKNEPSVYFLFNPFNDEVLKKVLVQILSISNCETVFIYMNPLYAKVFEELKIKQIKTYKSGFYIEAILFKI